jgi:peptidoglycan hydrolase-like amidase
MEAYLLGVVPSGDRPAAGVADRGDEGAGRRGAHVRRRQPERPAASRGFDFYATVMDQVYGGVQDEDSIVSRGVRETRGEIVTHNGTPILAYYARRAAAHRRHRGLVAGRAPLPYLRGVSDRIPGTDDYYCGTSNRFNWTTRWTRDQLLAVLGETLRAHTGGRVTSVPPHRRRAADRDATRPTACTVRLTADGTPYTLRADSLRWVLRPQPGPAILNSSKLASVQRDGCRRRVRTGDPRRRLGPRHRHVPGRRHQPRARRPVVREILRAYYTGIELQRLY